MKSKSFIDAAIDYRRKGYSVIPLHGKKPLLDWKCYQERKATLEEIENWAIQYTEMTGIGIVTGKISGITVLDFDLKSEGQATYQKLTVEHGEFPSTPRVKTGGGGRHLYFTYT